MAKESGCFVRIEKIPISFKIIVTLLLVIAAGIVFGGSVSFVMAAGSSGYPEHEPYGNGVGAMPGRVVWFHDKDSVEWDGNGYWWDTANFDESAIQKMVDQGIASLAGKADAKAGWDALFLANNRARGKASSYTKGEKIAIKANINGSGVFDDDNSGETRMSYTNPILLKCLLRSLVYEAGVSPQNITVYDVSRIFPGYMVELCTGGELQGIQFVGRKEGTADTDAPINWSYTFSGAVNYLPTCVTEANYLINLANLKDHSYGITLCAKNHFGSFINGNAMRPPEGANLHQWLTKNEMGIYSPLVDLMGNYQIGTKTVLYLLDALICAPSEGASITKGNSTWQQAPFNGDYTSSIFLSQDPVAIDSVGADFLMNEPTVTENNSSLRGNSNVENYLHEAGMVNDAPSGNVYYNGNGSRLLNLGVHEHWNNAQEKQYGRNLGREEGIELISLTPEKSTEEPKGKQKVLVAYFSCTNTTGTLAKYAAETLNADLYEIVPQIPYTEEDLAYYTGGRADREQNDPNVRPEISGSVENMREYDIIVLGYPIWHGQAPRIISTFLESYDLSGKIMVPFCTSHSSGIGQSAQNLHGLCPDSVKWADGRRFGAGTSKEEIGSWLMDAEIQTPDQEECSHSYQSQVTAEPTCTSAGTNTYTCIQCGRSYTEKIAAVGHKYQADVVKAGKEKDGHIAEICTVCGKEENGKTIAAVKSIRLSKTSYIYNGKKRKPSVIVTDRNEKKLREGTDYTVSYPVNLKNTGIYTVKIEFRGNYSGTEKISFRIVPKSTAIVSMSAKKRGFTVKWRKQAKQTDGYEIAYSASSKFPKKKTGIVNVGGSSKVSKTVSKLKAEKKYYVKIRTYKTVKTQGEREKVYSEWSKVKTVKTRK